MKMSILKFGVLSFILILALSSIIVSANPDLEFIGSYNVGSDVREIYVDDIDNDLSLDVIIASNDVVYVLNNDATLKWMYSAENLKSIFVSDTDNDGYKEVLISTGREIANIERGNFYVIDNGGNLKFKYPRSAPYSRFVFYSICAVDLNDNGYHEVICGFSTGVYALKDTYDKFSWSFKTNETITGIMVKDIEGDGNEEIIANSFSNLYVLDLDGIPIWEYSITEGIKEIIIDDISHTEGSEIILISKEDVIYILNSEFELIYPKTKLVNNILEVSTLDLNGDGLKEVILGSKNGVYILNSRFDMVKNKYETNDDVHGIYLADLDGDGEDEIIFGSGSYIYMITKQGDLKDKFYVGQEIDKLILEDLDYDGYMDILINSGNKIYLFENKESKESRIRDAAERYYRDAKGYFEVGRYDDANKSIDEAIRLYKEIGDIANVKECESLKKEIESKIIKEKNENADKIDEVIKEKERKDILSVFEISEGGISIFFIFSIFLLVVIIILLLLLLIKRK